MSKKQVYVSSTYIDLVEHRAALKVSLERAQLGASRSLRMA